MFKRRATLVPLMPSSHTQLPDVFQKTAAPFFFPVALLLLPLFLFDLFLFLRFVGLLSSLGDLLSFRQMLRDIDRFLPLIISSKSFVLALSSLTSASYMKHGVVVQLPAP